MTATMASTYKKKPFFVLQHRLDTKILLPQGLQVAEEQFLVTK